MVKLVSNLLLTYAKNSIYFFLFFINIIASNSQGIKLSVRNVKNEPIPFSLITDIKKQWGVTADSIGEFYLQKDILQRFDSLNISALGYQSKVIVSPDAAVSIILAESPLQLETVHIISKSSYRSKTIKLGSIAKSDRGMFGGVLDSNFEFALLIENSGNKSGLIEKVSFFIHSTGIYTSPFRIRIYKNVNGKPDTEITNKNIVVNGYKKGKWNTFDISKYNIEYPHNGCFVSMEWLNLGDRKYRYNSPMNTSGYGFGQTIGLTIEFPTSISYRRKNEGEWYSNELYWANFRLKNYNPMIRAEIYF
jgi:hypothetical protein